ATTMRNAMIALGLNFRASRPDADRSNARMLPATTTTTPRRASLRRQRFRVCRMISTSSARWLMDGSLSTMLHPRNPIREDCFGGEEQDAAEHQIPPDCRTAVALLRRERLAARA